MIYCVQGSRELFLLPNTPDVQYRSRKMLQIINGVDILAFLMIFSSLFCSALDPVILHLKINEYHRTKYKNELKKIQQLIGVKLTYSF